MHEQHVGKTLFVTPHLTKIIHISFFFDCNIYYPGIQLAFSRIFNN